MGRYYKTTYRITLVALCVAFVTLCSWIAIPFYVEFTLQLFAVFLLASALPPLISALGVISYILLGLVGAPVFASFKSGFSAFAGPTGGFIIGFLISSVLISIFIKLYPAHPLFHIGIMLLSLLICYACGIIWYLLVINGSGCVSVSEILIVFVVPYIVPDVLKIFLVRVIYKKLYPYFERLSTNP